MTPSPSQPEPAETDQAPPAASRRRTGLKVAGFVVGVGLLAWIVYDALSEQQFAGLANATWQQYAALVGCTIVSVVANGGIFWAIIHPVARVPLWEIQAVNAGVNLLNYAPVRLGMPARLAHHRRADGLSYSILIGWYAALACLMFMTLGCVLAATLIRPQVDAWWLALLAGLLATGCAACVYVGSHRMLAGRWQGASKMIAAPRWVVLAVLLRLIDMAAYGGRLYVAIAILGVDLTLRDAVYLTVISMVSTLAPIGSVGFREFAVSKLGSILLADSSLTTHLDAAVLLDRAGEVAVFIPLGVAALVWMARRWRQTRRDA